MRHGVQTPSKYFCVVNIGQDYGEGHDRDVPDRYERNGIKQDGRE